MSSFLRPTQFRLVEEEVENLITLYGENFHSISSPPVPVEMIAERQLDLHCLITEELKSGVLGVLLIENKQILINQECSKNQYYFTIAHEIGHWYLHRTQSKDNKFVDTAQTVTSLMRSQNLKGQSKRTSQQEIEANRFAAALLIPMSLLKPLITNQQTVSAPEVINLANTFQTSVLTMLYRVRYLKKYNELLDLRIDQLSLDTLEARERMSYQL